MPDLKGMEEILSACFAGHCARDRRHRKLCVSCSVSISRLVAKKVLYLVLLLVSVFSSTEPPKYVQSWPSWQCLGVLGYYFTCIWVLGCTLYRCWYLFSLLRVS